MSSKADHIIHLFGSYNMWTWFLSEFVYSDPLQALMSIDKQYVDHNYDTDKKENKECGIPDMNELLSKLEKQKHDFELLSHK